MVCMDLKELDIHRSRKNIMDLLSISPYVTIEGSVRSADIQELNKMFFTGSVYLINKEEAEEYLDLKRENEVRKFKEAKKTKEEENNEEHN